MLLTRLFSQLSIGAAATRGSGQSIAGPVTGQLPQWTRSWSTLATRFSPLQPLVAVSGERVGLVGQQIRSVHKLKTHKGAAKRWRRTGPSDKVGWKRGQAGKQHLNFSLSPQRLRDLRGPVRASKMHGRVLRHLLPHA